MAWLPTAGSSLGSALVGCLLGGWLGRCRRHGSHSRFGRSSLLLSCRATRRSDRAATAASVAQAPLPLEASWFSAMGEADELEAEDPNSMQTGSAWKLGSQVFRRELGELLLGLHNSGLSEQAKQLKDVFGLHEGTLPHAPVPACLASLTLDADKVAAREQERGVPETSPVVKVLFFSLCWALDRLYEGRPIQKFWVLETVARIPYFSYISVLHLYESLGWWRTPQLRHIHSAEEDNELHHLLIMEALGGNSLWFDRFMAQHAAIAYYWLVTGLFVAHPELAYNFSLLVEEHAYVTYQEFVEENKDALRRIPPPPVAREYYVSGDLYYFDKFQTSRRASTSGSEGKDRRRPPCEHLLDVFRNIRDDEFEHIQTMAACQSWWSGKGPSALPEEDQPTAQQRQDWLEWSARVNSLSSH